MKTITINTVGAVNQIAIFENTLKLSEFTSKEEEKRTGSENLSEEINRLLKATDLKFDDIELIIVVLGPGSYTGSRAGLSFAKALAHGGGTNIIGVSLFDVIAMDLNLNKFPTTLTIPAGPSRFYTKEYSTRLDLFESREKGLVQEENEINTQNKIDSSGQVTSEEINRYGQELFSKSGTDDFETILPLYLKEPNITVPRRIKK